MTIFFKTLLFISSYFPLYILLILNLLDYEKIFRDKFLYFNRIEGVIFSVIGLLILISFFSIIYLTKCKLNDSITSKQVKRKNEEILSYLVTYIIPLLIINPEKINTVITNGFLFVIIGFLYVKSNMVHINVLFLLFGWNIYEDLDGRLIISKENPDYFRRLDRMSSSIAVKQIGDKIYIHRKI